MGRNKKFSREGVLDKTIPVFWKHGLAETSVQDLELATGVNKSGLYAEFKNKDDLFIASLRRYLEVLQERGTLTKQPLGWGNIEAFLKLCYGSWGAERVLLRKLNARVFRSSDSGARTHDREREGDKAAVDTQSICGEGQERKQR